MQRPTQRIRLRSITLASLFILALLGPGFAFDQVRAQDETPVGDWSVALARTDIPVDIASSFSYVGRWHLRIQADGVYEAARTDVSGIQVTGRWEIDGDQITFSDEDGILSCANAAAAPVTNEDISTGTYTWSRSGKTLTLTRVDDACPGRVILLTTFAFSTFVACSTPPMSIAQLQGTPVAPVSQAAIAPVASPQTVSLDFTAEIDNLLDQLTACWASRQPEQWLPLLSSEFRESLIGSDPNLLETMTIAMTSPIAWERSGEITLEAPNRISTVVKSTVGTETDFQRFEFVFEDGQWKWNG